jgi:hypothetical protein
MRNLFITAGVIAFVTLSGFGQSSPHPKTLPPDGSLVGNLYSNEALEMRDNIPDGWIGSVGPTDAIILDPKQPDAAINVCSKTLLTIHEANQAPEGFHSISQIVAIDPSCFPGVKFPKSVTKENWNQDFMKVMIKAFSHSSFMSPHGADIDGFVAGGGQFVMLSGDEVADAAVGDAGPKQQIHVNHLIVFTESAGYWVAWMSTADDEAKSVLAKSNMQFLDHSRK